MEPLLSRDLDCNSLVSVDSKLVGDIRASCRGAQARVRKSSPREAHLEREMEDVMWIR